MSIFDRLKDIVSFLDSRPDSRTPEQEQVGQDIEEAAKIAEDKAASRLDGITEGEANSFMDTIRDFVNSDQKNIDEFRKKNKDKIARDRALFKKFTKLHPIKIVKDFLVDKAVRTYGPQITETITEYLKSFDAPGKKGSQFEFMGTIYELDDFFEAGKVDFTPTQGYDIDKDRKRVSPLRAYINLLPDDYSASAKDIYNNIRQAKNTYRNTPFGDFLSNAELKESGLEYVLLKFPEETFNKQSLLNFINSPDYSSNTQKVRYSRDEQLTLNNKEKYVRSLKEMNDQLDNLYDRRFLRLDVLKPIQDDVLKTIELVNQQFGEDTAMDDVRYGQLIDAARGNYTELINKYQEQQSQKNFGMSYQDLIKQNEQDQETLESTDMSVDINLYNEAYKRNLEFASFTKQFDALQQIVNQNLASLDVTVDGDENLLSYMSGSNAPSYRTHGPAGIKNYDVQGITVKIRGDSELGESGKGGTHFDGSWTGGQKHDTMHFRTGQLFDPQGVTYNTIVEIQSDDEGQIRREDQYYDPSVQMQQERIQQQITDFSNNDRINLQRIFKVTPQESNAITDILANAQRDSDVFVPASSDVVKDAIFDQFAGREATMIDNIPEANRENYLNNNDRATELFKYAKKLNKYLELLYRDDKLSRENRPGQVSKTLPYVSTGPLGYAEEGIYQYIMDSIRTGVDKIQWVPGEHSAQFQLSGPTRIEGVDFSNTATTLAQFNDERSVQRAQGHLNFYGTIDDPKNNTMYRASVNVVEKINKLGQQIYGDDFVPPVVYEQGAKNENGEFYNTYVVNDDELRGQGGYISNVKQGWGMIDLSPTIEYLRSKGYEQPRVELDEELLQNYVTRKRGGQVWSSSLVSLDEVING